MKSKSIIFGMLLVVLVVYMLQMTKGPIFDFPRETFSEEKQQQIEKLEREIPPLEKIVEEKTEEKENLTKTYDDLTATLAQDQTNKKAELEQEKNQLQATLDQLNVNIGIHNTKIAALRVKRDALELEAMQDTTTNMPKSKTGPVNFKKKKTGKTDLSISKSDSNGIKKDTDSESKVGGAGEANKGDMSNQSKPVKKKEDRPAGSADNIDQDNMGNSIQGKPPANQVRKGAKERFEMNEAMTEWKKKKPY